ncbi:hypothetical protein [Aquidulcibacter paucihalophilus]|uniref:hypothetical protein n=1 Tax=Aquidulcibacter paucihalophilus TaxID=1978549 RepID=UPI000A198A3C|nr:hypothetical protein [Aquidulcibacter paucihalophilus]
MTQKPKKPSKPRDAETIIHSDQGELTHFERTILDWRDRGLLDDPEPRIDDLAAGLNWLFRHDIGQRNLNIGDKPPAGYRKVKRGHRWILKRYADPINLHQELSSSQLEVLLNVLTRAEQLTKADTDPAQLKAGPTSMSRHTANSVYRQHGLPSVSKRYAIKDRADPSDIKSWIPEGCEEWGALGLPSPDRKVVNYFLLMDQERLHAPPAEGVTVFEAHQLPEFFGFDVDSVVSAAADVHEAALAVEQLEFAFPKPSFAKIVICSMGLQVKSGILADMIAKADPSDPKSLTISETVEARLVAVRTSSKNGKATGGENKKEKENKKEVVLVILTTEMATRKLTKTEAIDAVRREWPSRWKHKPRNLGHKMAEKYIDELRRSGLIPEWK